jgi:hypothetical protein
MFLLFAMPIVFFGSATAIDGVKVLMAARMAGNTADAAAAAGATQFAAPGDSEWQPGGGRVDVSDARAAADELVDEAVDGGMLRGVTVTDTTTRVTRETVGGRTRDVVTVEVDYDVTGLLFLAILSEQQVNGTISGTADRSAAVCVPGWAGNPSGSCVRP